MAPLVIGRPDRKGSTGRDNRLFVKGVLWIVRTGVPWRDLPEVLGGWNSTFHRFSRWSKMGIWRRIFAPANTRSGDDGAAIGLIDEYGRSVLAVQQPARRRKAVGEGAMHQHNIPDSLGPGR
jgi:putative transposase